MAIHDDPAKAWALTIRGNTVAVVSDGTAVLGLGDIGPVAAMPVMEGKALLFKEFAGVDAFPLCIDTKDVDEIVAFVKAAAPTFGGINLEDISAPRCFEIERRLRAELDIPVFHDDQHGTAIVVLAALLNALKIVGKRAEDVRVVVVGAGAAGVACTDILLAQGVGDVIVCNPGGALCVGDATLDASQSSLAERTNREHVRGSANAMLAGADVMIGVSAPGAVTADAVRTMAPDAIVFAMANPVPEVQPEEVRGDVAIMATGRSDYPNQINNVLAFPGVFKGALEVRAQDDQRGDEARRRGRDSARDPRRGAARRLHHPERVQPPGRRVGGRGRRQRSGRERGRAAQARRDRRADDAAGGPAMTDRLHFTESDEANQLLVSDPMALLIGFALDQQVTVQKAFSGPLVLRERLGTLDAATIAGADLDPIFRERPAIHRFPGAMAQRVHDLAVHIVETYDGDAGRVWGEDITPEELQRRLYALPGYGEMKVGSLIAVLARRFGVAAALPLVPSHPTLGDVDSPAALAEYQAGKRAHKAALRAAKA